MLRWRVRLDEPTQDAERGLDDFYAFFLAVYHLADWIKNDGTVDPAVRKTVFQTFRHTGSVGLAGDVANGQKHLTRDRRPNVDAAAHVSVLTCAIVEPEAPGHGVPPEAWEHGFRVRGEDTHEVADRCIREWYAFLRAPPRR